MSDDNDSKKAIEELNQAEFDGKVISVSIAKPKTETRPGGNRNFGEKPSFKRY